MLRADSPASMELVLGLYEQMRNIQERLNDATISNWALLTALAERDEAFADVYLAHKEKTEVSELGWPAVRWLNLAGGSVSPYSAYPETYPL
jgi:hypothetical protein